VKSTLAAYPEVRFAIQEEQLGTGHAVMAALPELPRDTSDVIILCGDTPLIRAETLGSLIEGHQKVGRSLTLLVTSLENPQGYGRVMTDVQGRLMRIVEESDAGDVERQVTTVNTGTYCVKVALLRRFLPALDSANVQGEFYLTDVIAQVYGENLPAAMVSAETAVEVLGVNTREDLVTAERLAGTMRRQVP
jgi:bifunctional N-acetylglucosamine-1-phosphate-uridyltransferase/glucosamine-1-phosphate-acetyltransferase GlmU-like protein